MRETQKTATARNCPAEANAEPVESPATRTLPFGKVRMGDNPTGIQKNSVDRPYQQVALQRPAHPSFRDYDQRTFQISNRVGRSWSTGLDSFET